MNSTNSSGTFDSLTPHLVGKFQVDSFSIRSSDYFDREGRRLVSNAKASFSIKQYECESLAAIKDPHNDKESFEAGLYNQYCGRVILLKSTDSSKLQGLYFGINQSESAKILFSTSESCSVEGLEHREFTDFSSEAFTGIVMENFIQQRCFIEKTLTGYSSKNLFKNIFGEEALIRTGPITDEIVVISTAQNAFQFADSIQLRRIDSFYENSNVSHFQNGVICRLVNTDPHTRVDVDSANDFALSFERDTSQLKEEQYVSVSWQTTIGSLVDLTLNHKVVLQSSAEFKSNAVLNYIETPGYSSLCGGGVSNLESNIIKKVCGEPWWSTVLFGGEPWRKVGFAGPIPNPNMTRYVVVPKIEGLFHKDKDRPGLYADCVPRMESCQSKLEAKYKMGCY